MFKNAIFYHTDIESFDIPVLDDFTSKPLKGYQTEGIGVSPVINDILVWEASGNQMIHIEFKKKIIPASAIKEKLKEKSEGGNLSKKELKDVKESITTELAMTALTASKVIKVVLNTKTGLLFIDTSSSSKADFVIEFLYKIFGMKCKAIDLSLPLTQWLARNETPSVDIDISDKVSLIDQESAKTTLINQDLTDVMDLFGDMSVDRLKLKFNNNLSCMVDSEGVLRSIRFTDIEIEGDDELSRFDSDFIICSKLVQKAHKNLVNVSEQL